MTFKVTAFFREDLEILGKEATWHINEAMAQSLWIDGNLVACAGISEIWKGVGMAWAVFGELPQGSTRRVALLFYDYLVRLMEWHGLWRVQADVKADFPAGHRFVRFLGFTHEGSMRAYGPDGADYERYSFVRC